MSYMMNACTVQVAFPRENLLLKSGMFWSNKVKQLSFIYFSVDMLLKTLLGICNIKCL